MSRRTFFSYGRDARPGREGGQWGGGRPAHLVRRSLGQGGALAGSLHTYGGLRYARDRREPVLEVEREEAKLQLECLREKIKWKYACLQRCSPSRGAHAAAPSPL